MNFKGCLTYSFCWIFPHLGSFLICVKLLQSCPTLCKPMDWGLPGSSIHGTLQARILEWGAMPSCRGPCWPRIKPASLMSPALAGGFFTTSTTWEAPVSLCTGANQYLAKRLRESFADLCVSPVFLFSSFPVGLPCVDFPCKWWPPRPL